MPRRSPIRNSIAALAILVAIVGGCGDSDGGGHGSSESGEPTATATTPAAPPGATARRCDQTAATEAEGLRVTGIGCEAGRGIVVAWIGAPACSRPTDASRFACTIGGYRCLGTATDAGIAVSCARAGSSAAFLVRRNT